MLTPIVLLLAAAQSPAPTMEAFFPLAPGTKWVYEESEGGAGTGSFTDIAGRPGEVGGAMAVPVRTMSGASQIAITYYRVEADQVVLVAFDDGVPLAQPYAIAKIGEGRVTWSFKGETNFFGDPVPLELAGSARRAGTRTVLGVRRNVLEVTLDATVGPADQAGIKSRQVSVYAEGVGLVEMRETRQLGQRKAERRRVLTSFTPGSGG